MAFNSFNTLKQDTTDQTSSVTQDRSVSPLSWDVWGTPRVSVDHSLFHGLWTYDIPARQWIEHYDDTESYPFVNATSVGGSLQLVSNGGKAGLHSKQHPRYQPNRGLKYSTAVIIDGATPGSGTLRAVIRTRDNATGTTIDDKKDIDTSSLDLSKGHVFDLQAQWRGVGNILFYADLATVCTFPYLGTLTKVSVSNPALPVSYEVTDTGVVRWGMFNDQNGMFFEFTFDTPQETQIVAGCVDVTSEGGYPAGKTYMSITTGFGDGFYSDNNSGLGSVVLAVRVPETIVYNTDTIDVTRDVELKRYTGSVRGDEGLHAVYAMRNTTAFDAAFAANGVTPTGSVMQYIVGGTNSGGTPNVAALQTAFEANIGNMELLTVRRSEIDTEVEITNPDGDSAPFLVTAGDYIFAVVKPDGGRDRTWSNLEFAEEI